MKEKQVDRGEGNYKEQAWKSRTLSSRHRNQGRKMIGPLEPRDLVCLPIAYFCLETEKNVEDLKERYKMKQYVGREREKTKQIKEERR